MTLRHVLPIRHTITALPKGAAQMVNVSGAAKNSRAKYVGLGVAIGAGIGIAIGAATGHVGLWLPIGIAVGIAVMGLAVSRMGRVAHST